jgi:hypothetical protein
MRWSLANGFSPKLELDRKDNDKGYNPKNCRWVTKYEGQINKRRTIWVEFNGERMSLMRACDKLGLNYNTVYARVQYGWSVYEALMI